MAAAVLQRARNGLRCIMLIKYFGLVFGLLVLTITMVRVVCRELCVSEAERVETFKIMLVWRLMSEGVDTETNRCRL